LIDAWSAHALSGPQVRRVLDSDTHAWNPEPVPFDITSYLYPQETYDRFFRNALRDPDARPIGFAAPSLEPLAPRNTTRLNVDTLRAGESVTRTVSIDANRAARFFAHWNEVASILRCARPTAPATRQIIFAMQRTSKPTSASLSRTQSRTHKPEHGR